jgi:hypothetical protein
MLNRENAGKRIELISTNDQFTDLTPGSQGVIQWERDDGYSNTIAVNWDNGSSLSLIAGTDRYRIL